MVRHALQSPSDCTTLSQTIPSANGSTGLLAQAAVRPVLDPALLHGHDGSLNGAYAASRAAYGGGDRLSTRLKLLSGTANPVRAMSMHAKLS